MATFRKGDVVSVEAVIDSDFIHPDSTVRFKFAIGDTVRLSGGFVTGTVLAVGEDHVWVSLGSGRFATWHAPTAERVEVESPPAEPAPEQAETGSNV